MNDFTRRRWIVGVAATGLCTLAGPDLVRAADASDLFTVQEISDPPGGDFPPKEESVKFSTEAVEAPLRVASRGPRKKAGEVAKRMLEISGGYADAKVSRDRAKPQVQQFLDLFGLPFMDPDNPKAFTRFCAAGVCFAACMAYCDEPPPIGYGSTDPAPALKGVKTDINKYYFKPHPAVRFIVADAKDRGSWVASKGAEPMPGWLVAFSWADDGTPNHIGIVDHLDDKSKILHTVEYNTSSTDNTDGGAVARRERKLDHVLGYVKLY